MKKKSKYIWATQIVFKTQQIITKIGYEIENQIIIPEIYKYILICDAYFQGILYVYQYYELNMKG